MCASIVTLGIAMSAPGQQRLIYPNSNSYA